MSEGRIWHQNEPGNSHHGILNRADNGEGKTE